MQRRTWTTDEKLAIVMAGLKQIQSVAELCREHQLSQTQYYKWRDQFLEGGKQYTRKIVGYDLSLRSRRQEWEAALDRALQAEFPDTGVAPGQR